MSKVGRPSFRPKMKTGRSLAKSSKPKYPKNDWYGDDWETLATYVKQRDNYTCRGNQLGLPPCNVRFPPPFSSILHAHHIVPLPKGPNHPKNLITLCNACHSKIHNRNLGSYTNKQKQAAKRFL